ncbi:hypothetical protein D7X30_21565 [Corallococcus sp. AB011P]|uniref:hypothetical protein n=1 Tax=unclassified Corallococcus TaxID=2685029 RepID=UPI000EA045D2|nr:MULTISPECIES: hypothetical protein [unclassified Corallococcus]RKG56749.1 hypothetical protein D7X30_21565 [Corallococcus sp. AB011P]RKH89587.1 hypothetical protein D7Y21_09985 [Corallococcus sp. AB045]
MSLRRPLSLFASLLMLGGCGTETLEEGAAPGQSKAALHTGIDLAVSGLGVTCDDGQVATVTGTIVNEAPTGIDPSVAGIYAGDPAEGGTLLATVNVPWLVGKERYAFETAVQVPEGTQKLFVVADAFNFFPEDSEENNTGSVTLAPGGGCLVNQAPVALCKNVTVAANASCSAAASIDDGSYDPDGFPQPLSLTSSPAGQYPVGTTPVTLTVSDGMDSATCSATVTVVDATAPVAGASKNLVLARTLGADYKTVTLADCAQPAADTCGGTLDLQQSASIIRVESDESEDALFSLALFKCQDIKLSADRKSAQLRAESSLLGNGRVYTMVYSVADASGNATIGTCKVKVPSPLGILSVGLGPNYCQGEGCPAGTGNGLLCPLL